jgi:non-heme chloroperoxidase
MGPTLPYPIQTPDNPSAPSRDLWDNILTSLRTSRAAFVQASLPNPFSAHTGTEVEPATLARFERIIDHADALAIERCLRMLDHDFTSKPTALKTASVLIRQGDSDQNMPYEAGTKMIEALIPGARVSMYEKAGHGLYLTHAAKVVDDILGFVERVEVDARTNTNTEAAFADRSRGYLIKYLSTLAEDLDSFQSLVNICRRLLVG